MRKIVLLFITAILSLGSAFAGPGDTTIVQAFTFSDITKRRGWYEFPSDSLKWHKILMYYTLKCDAATTQDGYPCGEWDYTTYTNLYQYQNVNTPYYTVNGFGPDSIMYTTNPVYTLSQNWQYNTVIDNTLSENSFSIGSGSVQLNHPLLTSLANGRSQYLWLAAELSNAGLIAGNINKLNLDISSLGSEINGLIIRMKNSSLNELSSTAFENDNFTTVYEHNTQFLSTGANEIICTLPFNWDGSSNIVIDFSFSGSISGTGYNVNGETTAFNSGVYSASDDGFLSFFKTDYGEIPNQAFASIDSFITVSFWQFGDPNLQPSNSYIFEGKDNNNNRVINCHLPWSNSRVYWDAGNSGTASYDRIDKAANYSDFAGKWNHWAFTKNVATGTMKIFLNGSLWHSGTGLSRTMAGISKFKIAGQADTYGVYDGYINEFRVWNIDLNETVIADWMYKDISPSHPNYSNLMAYYKFNDMNYSNAVDSSPNGYDGQLMGLPQWKYTEGNMAFRNMLETSQRPNIVLVQGEYTSHLDSTLVTDSLINGQVSIIEQQPNINTNFSGVQLNVLDTIFGWLAGYTYTYDPNGSVVDSSWIDPDATLYNYYEATTHQIQNYVTPYGINLNLGTNGFRWVYDVTDYALLFHDTVELSAGNQQELLDLKFVFIEGTPVRDIVDFETIWLGDYGHASIADDVSLPAVNIQLNSAASMYTVRTRTTGHWFGEGENCAEFCPKNHHLEIDGVMQFQWLNWKECADNPVFPQGGTWIYDRAGWCPGSFADTYNHDITPFVNQGEVVSLNYGMEPYPVGGGEGNYRTTVQLISYGANNFNLDAAIVDIIAPNNWEFYKRFNPTCGRPVIKIRNTGATNLISLNIAYGINGDLSNTYTWTGNLDFNEEAEVTLNPMDYNFAPGNGQTFEVMISAPNNGTDQYTLNNYMKTKFDLPEVFDDIFFIYLRTNSFPNETYYHIYDDIGNIVYEKSNLVANHLYYDTIDLPQGCYEFVLYDTDDDGINFWANNDGSGYIYFRRNGSTQYNYKQHDFGKYLRINFKVNGYPTGIVSQKLSKTTINIYPNPSEGIFIADINMLEQQDLTLLITDVTGNTVYNNELRGVINEKLSIDLSHLSKGIYIVRAVTKTDNMIRKIVIQ